VTKLTILTHSSASVERILALVVNRITTEKDSLKKALLRKACWQNKHSRRCMGR